jgi:hypothetical protein
VPLDPEAAVALLRLLSVDLRGVALLDDGGALLAGDAGLEARPGVLRVGDGRRTVLLHAGAQVLEPLLRADAERVLRALER